MGDLKTTLVGSMPKPDYVKIPYWGSVEYNKMFDIYNDVHSKYTKEELIDQVTRATQQLVQLQTDIGKNYSICKGE